MQVDMKSYADGKMLLAWVTRPEGPKGVKDKANWPKGRPSRSQGLEGPQTSGGNILLFATFDSAAGFVPHHSIKSTFGSTNLGTC